MATATHPPDGADHDYGMGWHHTSVGGQPAIAHDGMLATSPAYQLMLPDTGHGIALVANGSHVFSDLHAIADDLAAMVAGDMTRGTVSQHRLIVGFLVAAILLGVAVRTAGVMRRRSWAERRRDGPGGVATSASAGSSSRSCCWPRCHSSSASRPGACSPIASSRWLLRSWCSGW